MPIRAIAKVLRGRATPLQLALACTLGAMLGFMPGLWQAPGLIVTLLILLIILNANLVLAALVTGVSKLLSLVLIPVSFMAGRFLLDGPSSPVFEAAINAPVLALMGFQCYVTTGGLALGLVAGLAFSVIVITLVAAFRAQMARVEADSDRYKKFAANPLVRISALVLFGPGKGKATYADLNKKKFGLPVRPLGIVFVGLVGALAYLTLEFAREPIVTAMTRASLQQATGATVDVGSATVDPGTGKLVVTGLAMANPDALDRDILRASRVEGDVSTRELLRGRVTIDALVLHDAAHDQPRQIRGRLIRPRPAPPPPPAPAPESKTLDDYLKEAELWRDRLRQIERLLDELGKRRAAEGPSDPSKPEKRETLEERLRRLVKERGYYNVKADHLIDRTPAVVITTAEAAGVKSAADATRSFTVRASNVSTHPWLLPDPPRLEVVAEDGSLDGTFSLGGAAQAPSATQFTLRARGLSADAIGAALKTAGAAPLQGGTVDVDLSAALVPGERLAIDAPLRVTARDTTVTLPELGSAKVVALDLPITLKGPFAEPSISISSEDLSKALTDAGASALAGKVKDEANKAINKATEKAKEEVQEKAKGIIGDLLGRDKNK